MVGKQAAMERSHPVRDPCSPALHFLSLQFSPLRSEMIKTTVVLSIKYYTGID